ncbi:DNA cytosine methyltransferase [Paracoccus thiocyanatus]|uniref:DNA (cytosine-5-)-methyltransferase n=1 Tax=Paracoccus thiocyanatus TaxID=34006 RepID=A0A3D8PEC6_9RHOB|nr:DNA cytosine methyltransferase [Paracoccus thiocyanatus]RDW14403.1 DNA methyltransferase [Paracoccus thiocyanatus]
MTFHPHLPLIIDSFAGGGGASTGIEMALGRSPDVAINHSAKALALHAANHPSTLHLDSNIWDVDPLSVTKGRHVGLLWASPDCKHFSKAKGGAPRDRNIRDLAWVVVKWAEDAKPDVICMENVEEFVTWGPLDNDGQPIKELAGVTFDLWLKRLKKAGYRVQWRELRACDYGAPTIRKRWFLIARRDGRPIVWPKPTHGDPKSKEVRKGKLLPWVGAHTCIDWSLPCPSIFDTSAEVMAKHGLRAVRPLAKNTMARVARGMGRYVIESQDPFLVILKGTDRRDRPVNAPHPTVLAGGGHSSLVVPSIVGCGGRAGQSRPRGGDEPFATITAKADGCIATATLAPSIQRFNGGATGQDMRDPMATVTANSWIKKPGGAAPLGMLAPYLATMRNSQKPWQRADEPTHTITAGGAGLTLTAPYLATFYGHGGGRSERAADLVEPLRTVTVENRHALIAPVLTYAQQGGGNRSVEDPHHTICASRKDQNSLIAATMVHVGNGERAGQKPRALDVCAPLNTVVAGGVKHYPVSAFLAQQNGGPRMDAHAGHDLRDPISTIAASGSHQTPVAAFFAKYYGTGDGARTDGPMHTITVKDRMAHMQAELAAPPFAPEHHARARQVAEFLREHGAWDGGEFVTLEVEGVTCVVIDIGMRMLTPRELFRAQGFPDDYVIEGVWREDEAGEWRWQPFAKDVQVSCCGNSVCPPIAAAIVGANCRHIAIEEERRMA